MNVASSLRTLRASALAVTVFSLVLLLAGAAQIVLGGIAIKQHYADMAEMRARAEADAAAFGYYQPQINMEYQTSSSAFIEQGGYLPTDLDSFTWASPSVVASLALLLAGIGFMIAALVWVWRAHANIARTGAAVKFGPGKALAAYLIPLVNLILPFEAMRELFNRSHGEPEELVDSSVDDVTAWWIAVVIGLLIFSAMVVKFAFDQGTNAIVMTPLWMEYTILSFAIVLLLGSAFLFSRLARAITRAQEELLPQIDFDHVTQQVPQRRSVRIVG